MDNRADFTGPFLTGNILPAGARPNGGMAGRREGGRDADEEGAKRGRGGNVEGEMGERRMESGADTEREGV